METGRDFENPFYFFTKKREIGECDGIYAKYKKAGNRIQETVKGIKWNS